MSEKAGWPFGIVEEVLMISFDPLMTLIEYQTIVQGRLILCIGQKLAPWLAEGCSLGNVLIVLPPNCHCHMTTYFQAICGNYNKNICLWDKMEMVHELGWRNRSVFWICFFQSLKSQWCVIKRWSVASRYGEFAAWVETLTIRFGLHPQDINPKLAIREKKRNSIKGDCSSFVWFFFLAKHVSVSFVSLLHNNIGISIKKKLQRDIRVATWKLKSVFGPFE